MGNDNFAFELALQRNEKNNVKKVLGSLTYMQYSIILLQPFSILLLKLHVIHEFKIFLVYILYLSREYMWHAPDLRDSMLWHKLFPSSQFLSIAPGHSEGVRPCRTVASWYLVYVWVFHMIAKVHHTSMSSFNFCFTFFCSKWLLS